MVTEWGKPVFWADFSTGSDNFGFTRTVKPNEIAPRIQLKRTDKGWKLDDYVPGPNRLIKQYAKFGPAWNLK